MKTTRGPESRCPKCASVLDASTSPENAEPSPDDFSVCGYCAAPLRFNADLTVRLASSADLEDLNRETLDRLAAFQRVIRRLQRRA